MRTTKESNYIAIIGALAFLGLTILAWVFYLERTVFSDVAFHTVTILKKQSLFIQNQRFVAAFTQLFPLSAERLGMSLEGVLKLYSLSFVCLQALVFTLCVAWLKQWRIGLVMLFVSLLMVQETFYWVQSELPQGMAVLVLFLAVIFRIGDTTRPANSWLTGLAFSLLLTVCYAHPMLLFPTLFALLYLQLPQLKTSTSQRHLLRSATLFTLFVVIVKNKLLGATAYDSEAMSRVNNLIQMFPNYFSIPANGVFLKWCLTDYWLLTLGFLGINTLYVRQKQWLAALLFNAFFFGYLLLVNGSFPDSFHQYYIENLYLPLGFFVALPLALEVMPALKKWIKIPHWEYWLLGGVLLIRLISIGLAHRSWTERLNWQREFMAANPGKVMVAEKQLPMDKLLMSWGSSFEFMLLSSLENPANTRCIFFDEDPNRMAWATNQPRSIITEWEVFKFDDLPKRYFQPSDTSLYTIRKE